MYVITVYEKTKRKTKKQKEKKRISQREWRKKNPDKSKEYYEFNKEKIKTRNRIYRNKNRVKIKKFNKQYKEKHIFEIKDYRKWYYWNIEKIKRNILSNIKWTTKKHKSPSKFHPWRNNGTEIGTFLGIEKSRFNL